ncbi:sensor histidine kinase [uncultured Ruthenibacterium sp.]|uniref:sensor histidine kinase n=1 Tax=uncultured Ruthenibacterium sp. TaxID=1905347 RepID=UPI00349E7FDF
MNEHSLPYLLFAYCRTIYHVALSVLLALAGLFLLTVFYHAPMELPIYISFLTVAIGSLLFARGFSHFVRRHRELHVLFMQCNSKLSALPHSTNLLEQDWEAIVDALEKNRLDAERRDFLRQQDASQYYTLWAHQIKTPLAALNLLVQEIPDPRCKGEMKQELFKTEQYVDMVLGYLRLESMHGDLVPQTLRLMDIVTASAKHVSSLFIHNSKIKLCIDPIDLAVTTDSKWMEFVLEQILTNSAKYTHHGFVRVYTHGTVLTVEDTGIGILEEELPRIFERGFTGYNGRANEKSTGLGLYLCNQICQNLGHKLSISSKPGQGTKVNIDFGRPQLSLD